MATISIARQLGSLFEAGTSAGLSDRQLLERFTAHGEPPDEAAFAAIVARHGPMVLSVCRQLLGDRQHAEDAFQATFLVLARRAHSIRDPDALGPWLHGVALRVARKARAKRARRRLIEGQGAAIRPEARDDHPADRAIGREHAEALHVEIDRLPGAFRLPIVLCYFEGLSPDEAAARLRCPGGTLRSRLARARERLRRGLMRRGVALTVALAPRPAEAPIPPLLCEATAQLATAFAARLAAGASAAPLAREILRSMAIHRLRTAALTALLIGALGVGACALAALASPRDGDPNRQGEAPSQPAAQAVRTDPRPAPGRMFVVGRVIAPDGRPAADAPVEIIGRRREPAVALKDTWSPHALLGRGRTDADGRFRIDAPRTSSTGFIEVQAIAAVPGVGLGWAAPNPDADRPAIEIRLRPERPIRGKLMDVTGAPAAGVEIRVNSLARPTADGPADWVGPRPDDALNWPRSARTDENGRFAIAGIGRDTIAYLHVRDPRFAVQGLTARTDDGRDGPLELTMALQPSTIVEGRALAADTGRPIPRAIVHVGSSLTEFFSGDGPSFPADESGRFRAHVAPGTFYSLRAYPPEGSPYLITEQRFQWPKGAVTTTRDIAAPRGVLIRGRVVEDGTDRPLAGASVQFSAYPRRDDIVSEWQAIVGSKEDGSFSIAVPPGRGHLLVFGPTADYIAREIGHTELWNGRPGGWRVYAHAIVPYDVGLEQTPPEMTVALRPGKTVRGRVLDPDGQPVEHATILTRIDVGDTHTRWAGHHVLHAREGRFELHGLDPENAVPVIFFAAGRGLGAAVELSGRQAAEEPIIRLRPNGRATARFVGPDGRPVAGYRLGFAFEIVVTPGPPNLGRRKEDRGRRLADAGDLINLDRAHYLDFPRADASGRVTLPNLVPGATYRICDRSSQDDSDKGVQVRRDFTVAPGETRDLGDILIERP